MRSRYSAFVLQDEDYLATSWATATRPPEIGFVPGQLWAGLDIIDVVGGGIADDHGIVEFHAHHERGGRAGVHSERSAFVREAGRWVYLGPSIA